MQAQQLMTADPACCRPTATAREAARQMIDHDCGCLPVVDDDRKVTGVVTDRDLATRGLGEGHGPDTPVADLMSSPAVCCGPGTDTAEAAQMMAHHQMRRVPVVDEENRIVGIVAQADVARQADLDAGAVAGTVAQVSQPISDSRSLDPDGPGRTAR